MMTVRLRLGAMLARWALRERKQPKSHVSRLPLTCQIFDCDINRHMNNSRYLALMDLGRYHLLLVNGFMDEVFRRRWFPVLVHAEIDFKQSLKPGDRFTLETSVDQVGTKTVTLLQRFWRHGELIAEARAVGLFLHKGKSQNLREFYLAHPQYLPESLRASLSADFADMPG